MFCGKCGNGIRRHADGHTRENQTFSSTSDDRCKRKREKTRTTNHLGAIRKTLGLDTLSIVYWNWGLTSSLDEVCSSEDGKFWKLLMSPDTYSSLPNKRTSQISVQGRVEFWQKINKRTGLNMRTGRNFAQSTKISAGWKLVVLFIITKALFTLWMC